MQLLLIFDFDNTLGDTYWPYGEGNIFRTKTLSDIQKATEIYEKYRRWPDDILVYPKLLEEFWILDPMKFFHEAEMEKQLYPDVVSFFEEIHGNTEIKTIILTTGDEDFQKLKLSITGVDILVDEVFITRNRDKHTHIRTLVEKYHPAMTFFTDDRIRDMKSTDFDFPITIFEMDRTGEKMGENVIHSLHELPLARFLWKK